MVRGRRGDRRRGARGGGATPPTASTPEGSNPQGGEQALGQEQIAIADVVGMTYLRLLLRRDLDIMSLLFYLLD